jgi:hypothetical protein
VDVEVGVEVEVEAEVEVHVSDWLPVWATSRIASALGRGQSHTDPREKESVPLSGTEFRTAN